MSYFILLYDENVITITSFGYSSYLSLRIYLQLFTWGRTQDNRLGHGDDRAAADQQLPKDIAALDQINIIKVGMTSLGH